MQSNIHSVLPALRDRIVHRAKLMVMGQYGRAIFIRSRMASGLNAVSLTRSARSNYSSPTVGEHGAVTLGLLLFFLHGLVSVWRKELGLL